MSVLADIFDTDALAAALDGGYVRVQQHPALPLSIYNYTEKAQYEGVWTPVTLACRGLIVASDGTVVARPLPKFFNYGTADAPVVDATAPAHVTDKADGSLGIIYASPDGSGYAVATRGSFASDQALHATALLRSRYGSFVPPAGFTVLVEIIFPANRIVVDYDGLDDLMLLGAVEIATGRTSGPEAVPSWPGPVVARFDHATLADALAAPPRPGREGFVVWFPSSDVRIKIKYDEYVRLHRIVTGLNARVVWAALTGGSSIGDIVDGMPDEFHPWVRDVVAELTAGVEARADAIEAAYAQLVAGLPDGWQRRDFAMVASRHPDRGALFLRLDEKDYTRFLWHEARPDVTWTPSARTFDED